MIKHFEEFAIPSLVDFVDRDRDKMLLCYTRALGRSNTGLSAVVSSYQQLRGKCRSAWNTFSFWVRLVVSDAYHSATDEDWKPIKVKAHSDESCNEAVETEFLLWAANKVA